MDFKTALLMARETDEVEVFMDGSPHHYKLMYCGEKVGNIYPHPLMGELPKHIPTKDINFMYDIKSDMLRELKKKRV